MAGPQENNLISVPGTVIVTGAASGIGRATVEVLAANGSRRLALWDTNGEGLASLGEAISGNDIEVSSRVLDISDRQAVHAAFADFEKEFGIAEAVLHIAGISSRVPFAEIDDKDASRILDVNLKGSIWVAQAAIEMMQKNPAGGSLVLTSSVSARRGPVHGNVAYASSKGGVNTLTRTLARQYGKYNIRVNAVSPGQIITPLSMWGWSEEEKKEKMRAREEVARAEVVLGRSGQPHEVAKALVFLASDSASYITGEILEVNGGLHFD